MKRVYPFTKTDDRILSEFRKRDRLLIDHDLKLSNCFLEVTLAEQIRTRPSRIKRLKEVQPYPSTYTLAQFASKVYDVKEIDETDGQYEIRLGLSEGWKVLTTANSEIGSWNKTSSAISSYYGVAFYNDNRQVVISHRGSDPRNADAPRMDLEGISQGYAPQINSACVFAHKVLDALTAIHANSSSWQIFLTGHAFGGWLAQVTTFSMKYLMPDIEVNGFVKNLEPGMYNAHAEVFDSPGCKESLMKMARDFDVPCDQSWAFLDITNYVTEPNFINCSRSHVGKMYRIFPEIDVEIWPSFTMKRLLKSFDPDTGLAHRDQAGRLKMKDVIRWPNISFFMFETHKGIYEWIKVFKNFTPGEDDATYLEENDSDFIPIRYHTKPYRENTFHLNVFTETELDFLRIYQWLRHESELLKSYFTFPSRVKKTSDTDYRSFLASQFQQISLHGGIFSYNGAMDTRLLVPFIKELLINFPELLTDAKNVKASFQAKKNVYDKASKEFCRQMNLKAAIFKGCTSIAKRIETFLEESGSVVLHIVAQDNVALVTAQVFKALQDVECLPAFYCTLALELQTLIAIDKYFKFVDVLKTEAFGKTLVVLEVNVERCKKEEVDLFGIHLLTSLRGKLNVKLILITRQNDEVSDNINTFGSNHLSGSYERVISKAGSWSDLKEETQRHLLSKKLVKFQGQGENFSLGDIIFRDEPTNVDLRRLDKIIDRATVVKLVEDELIVIGKDVEGLGEIIDYYIHRKIRYFSHYIDKTFLDDLSADNIVAISGFGIAEIASPWIKKENIRMFHEKKDCQIVLVNSAENFADLCRMNERKNVHWLKYEYGSFLWFKTMGNLNSLRKYVEEKDEVCISEESLVARAGQSKTIIISDTAGMGKSTLLHVLAGKLKEKYPRFWVLHVNLNDCSRILQEANERKIAGGSYKGGKPVQFLLDEMLAENPHSKLNDSFEKTLFEDSLTKSGGIILLFDAFDEISPDYGSIVTELITDLQNTRVKSVFVTTRPHTKDELENILGIFSYTMKPFSVEDQENFLVQFWEKRSGTRRYSKKDLEIYARESIEKLTTSIKDTEREFMGVPLQCRLLGEFMLDLIEKGKHELPNIYLFDLYDDFTRKKLEIFQLEKSAKTEGKLPAEAQKKLMMALLRELHFEYSLRIILSKDTLEDLRYTEMYDDVREILESQLIKEGIMLKSGDNPQFIHRTFAEFFLLNYLLKQTERPVPKRKESAVHLLTKEILRKPKMGVIRSFLNSLIRSGKRADTTSHILRSYAEKELDNWPDDVDACKNENGETVLHIILKENHQEIFFVFFPSLVSKYSTTKIKSYINVMNKFNITAIYYATQYGNEAIFATLLGGGADVYAKANDGKLRVARDFENDFFKMSHSLLKQKEFIQAHTHSTLHAAAGTGDLETVMSILEQGTNVDTSDEKGWTSLHFASLSGNERVALLLIGKGADVNRRSKDGFTPLMMASESGSLEVALVLIENRADINCYHEKADTALFAATRNGQHQMLLLLVKNGADVNVRGKNQWTALHEASRCGYHDIALSLIENGAEIDPRTKDEGTPLHLACENGQENIVNLLLEKGADVNAKSENQQTPLHVVSKLGYQVIARCLIENGAEINSRNENENTPLHIASDNDQRKISLLLIENKAEVNAVNENDHTPLHLACSACHKDMALLLIEKGAEVNAKDRDLWTPLLIACNEGHLDLVESLLEKGSDVNAQNKDECSALHLAAANDQCNIVSPLLKMGAKINAGNVNKSTPLHLACENGLQKMAILLIKMEADVNALDCFDCTPLLTACEKGNQPLVHLLIENGARIDALTHDKWTALHLASEHGHRDIARIFLENGIDINARNKYGETALHLAAQFGHHDVASLLIEKGVDISAKTRDKCTALLVACEFGFQEIVFSLIEAGADVNAFQKDKWTGLHLASHEGHTDIALALIKKGARVNARRKDGWTPLHLACQEDHGEIAATLIANGAEINASCRDKSTPLHVVSQYGHTEIAILLADKGAEINACNEGKMTPLHLASANGQADTVKLLLEKGAEIDAREAQGWTPFIAACNTGQVDVVRVFIERGVGIDVGDHDKDTPLHHACYHGQEEIVRLLLENEASVNLVNNSKITPLHMAAEQGHPKIVQWLLERGANTRARDDEYQTPLDIALKEEKTEVAKILSSYK